MKRLNLALAMLVLFFGPVAAADLQFADPSRLNVDATSVDIRVEQAPSQEYPHVGHRAPVPFGPGLKQWADTHFVLTGGSVNTLRITMRNGDITEKLLPVKKGIAGWFRKDQAAEYAAGIEVEVALVGPNGEMKGSANGKATLTRTMIEGATDADRIQVWSEMVKTTFDNLDKELLPNVRQSMGAYIR